MTHSGTPVAFDPFLSVPPLKKSATWPTWPLLLLLPIVALSLTALTLRQGTFGQASDFQMVNDVRRSLGISESSRSQPRFTLVRDFTHIILIAVICLTLPIVHRQWRMMKLCVPALVASGALRDRGTPSYSRLHRVLFIKRFVEHRPAGTTGLQGLVRSANTGLNRAGHTGLVLIVLAALLTAMSLVIGANQNGIFRAYAGNLSAGQEVPWVSDSYRSWWASIYHPAGFLVYICLMALGMFLVLIQNLVGLISIWTFFGFTAVAERDLDWLNRDGVFGWKSVTDTYRTVVLSLTIHGTAMSITLLAFGFNNVPWVIVVLIIWSIMLPTVTVVPAYALHGMSAAAQQRRIATLYATATATGPLSPIEEENFRKRIEEVRAISVRPLRVIRRIELPAFFVAVILPIVLTAVQVYFSIQGGPQK
ncbi:hypothetical protein ACIA8C_21150 [Nocardia sp. NPDC051321]|uniref:hypothetical protein n=1 Tax=Nocardia sp. NPDC051321 TaxID=3364323 RepID=UPI0037AA87B4